MSDKREKLVHYLNIGSATTASYELLGDGITSLTEEFNPTTNTKQYINQANGSTSVDSYAPSIDVEREHIHGDALQNWWDEKVKLLPTGSDAETDYVRINLFNTTSTSNVYSAVKRKCTFAFNSIGGDAGSDWMDSMTLGGVGDGIQGTFNVQTKTFTPNA